MGFLIALLIFGNVATNNVTQTSQTNIQTQEIEQITPEKEGLLLTLERTPCFGMCPTYKYSIFSTGRVIYKGTKNIDKIGSYSIQLTKVQISEIKSLIKSNNIFGLKNKYDSNVTDIPSTLLIITLDGKKKKIYDRHGAPKELKDFEKFIDNMVLNSKMTKIQDK